jgi:iron complex transport system substrate-binding protein
MLKRRSFLTGMAACASLHVQRACASAETRDVLPSFKGHGDHALSIRDDLGARLVVKAPMSRLVVFNRYTAEFVRAVAGSEVIIGVDAATAKDRAYWPNLHAAITGEGQTHPNYEAIVTAQPDCVLLPRNGDWESARRSLAPFDIPVIVITAWDVLKHEANVSLLGRLLAKEARAAELNAFYNYYRNIISLRTAGLARKRVYFEEVGDYMTVLKGSGWHDMIEIAGGINIFGNVKVTDQPMAPDYVQSFAIDPEEIAERSPDIFVKLQPNQYAPHSKGFSAAVLNAIAKRPCCTNLPAIETGEVYHMSYFLAGGCSKITGALQLAKWLYPQEFADIDPGEAMRVWLERFQYVSYPGDYWISLAQIRR